MDYVYKKYTRMKYNNFLYTFYFSLLVKISSLFFSSIATEIVIDSYARSNCLHDDRKYPKRDIILLLFRQSLENISRLRREENTRLVAVVFSDDSDVFE